MAPAYAVGSTNQCVCWMVSAQVVAGKAGSDRTSEIGVRVALGANPGSVLKQTIWYGMRPALIGIGAGPTCAFGLSRLLTNVLFGIEPSDPVTYAGVVLVLGIAALLSCYLPARRALRVDPVAALREE